ncbi:MAG: SRPBCC family protein [Candidatus Viridilinea halotolerans]|uniref:SRPBCC family protein n=1 Tax=Candidatus Viridilinea halotolerans TaxID=2491704 RepID=A0A426TR97_9CHLR|nr:MAG: SRPBCC family protein [Candidatus Viridilinea halotolerans]
MATKHYAHLMEEFVVVAAPMERVATVMTDHELMVRWISGSVQFTPVDGWQFAQGARWRLTLSGVGRLLEAHYVVYERRPGLILWAFHGFWEGFDAWHWLEQDGGQTLIQNRIEYNVCIPGLSLLWPFTVGPLMSWDAQGQMQRLKQVCEER